MAVIYRRTLGQLTNNELGRLWKELLMPYAWHLPGLPKVAEEKTEIPVKIIGFATGITTGLVTLRVFRLSKRCSWVLLLFRDVTLQHCVIFPRPFETTTKGR
jgi:hypothetical protein